MTHCIDGLTLTDAQLAKVKAICDLPEVMVARKVITLYRVDQEAWALFRVSAANKLADITVRAVLNRPLKVAQAEFVNAWLVDRNPMFKDYFSALNKALGRTYIQGPDMANYKCPQCGSSELNVAVTVWVNLIQYEDNQETDYVGGDHEWDNYSNMTCTQCGHTDTASHFIEQEEL